MNPRPLTPDHLLFFCIADVSLPLRGRKLAVATSQPVYTVRVLLYGALIPVDLVSSQITKADLEQRHPQLDFVFTLAQNLKNKASSSDVRTAITEKRKFKKKYSIDS